MVIFYVTKICDNDDFKYISQENARPYNFANANKLHLNE